MAKKNMIIQIGGDELRFSKEILDKFNYLRLPGNYDVISDKEKVKIFQADTFNPKMGRNVYIFGKDATLLQNFPKLLEQFPAYQLFFDSSAKVNSEQRIILEKKFSIAIDLEDTQALRNTFDKFLDLATPQYGYKLSMDNLYVKEDFKGTITKKGNSSVEITGEFEEDMSQIITWKIHPHGINPQSKLAFIPETMIKSGAIELLYKIHLIDQQTNEITDIISGTPEEFRAQEKIITNLTDKNKFISLSLSAKGGEGSVEIGQSHFRNYLSDGSIMIPNGKRLIDTEVRHEELYHYFHPGDMKPPLAVYFSGYRSAEGFEGRGMMGQMGCPFMLIGDPRLEGGNFYLGSDNLEKEVARVIKEKLEWLGFSNDQLILSGLSMGTFGSLYYAKDLEPAAIIIGKPLANIGTIAINERINRPEIWGTSLDMVTHFGGKSQNSVAEALDRKFWDKFETGHYNKTTFAIAYMEDDDYDGEAFPMIASSLKKYSPEAKVLHKGFIGRHNDNSPGVNTWFLKQYRNILWHHYGRKIDYRV